MNENVHSYLVELRYCSARDAIAFALTIAFLTSSGTATCLVVQVAEAIPKVFDVIHSCGIGPTEIAVL